MMPMLNAHGNDRSGDFSRHDDRTDHSPHGAAKYQMLIMFLIAGATALGSFLAAVGGVMLLTDERQRLRLDVR